MMDRIRLLERRDVDEIIILDISATPNNRGPRYEEIKGLCENLFMPVTFGGGVRSLNDIRRLLACGADKIAIGNAGIERPELISESAAKFGSQAVVVSIDVGNHENGLHQDQEGPRVFSKSGRIKTGLCPVAWAQEVEDRGAGEILLTSIDHDGMMDGFDIDLIREVSDAIDIPVIAAGGCGSYEHIAEVLRETKAHAIAVGAAFQFCDMTPKGACRYLAEQGFQVRL